LSTFGVPLLGEVQVVLVQRVFGVGPAADVALGQVRALALLGAVLIGEGGAAADVGFDVEVHDQRGVERNCEVGGTKAFDLAQPCGGFAHQAYARAPLILRHALHVEQTLDECRGSRRIAIDPSELCRRCDQLRLGVP
jgi:hypothetical protein